MSNAFMRLWHSHFLAQNARINLLRGSWKVCRSLWAKLLWEGRQASKPLRAASGEGGRGGRHFFEFTLASSAHINNIHYNLAATHKTLFIEVMPGFVFKELFINRIKREKILWEKSLHFFSHSLHWMQNWVGIQVAGNVPRERMLF